MKILYITTIGSTMGFFKSFIKELIDGGHTIDIATNEKDNNLVPECYREWGCVIYQVDCCRSPLSKGNLRAINQIKTLVEENHYDIVHCHTPIAAMCTRLACRKVRKQGTKVFYTAHGFHFYKGAPWKNWLIYYPVEKICSYFTDVLITINQEDYEIAKRKFHAKKVEYVPGVGIDLEKFGNVVIDKDEVRFVKRNEIGIPQDAKWLLNVGELIPRKNQETLIKAVAELDDVYLTIAGCGVIEEKLVTLIQKLNVSNRVKLLGFRKDIAELCMACDVFVFSSFHEGLPVAVMEAMASGLPIACSRIRGNTDLIDEADETGNGGGCLFDPHSVGECREAIIKVLGMDLQLLGIYNSRRIRDFSVDMVNKVMTDLYGNI